MREIKFRAWDKALNQMANVTSIDFSENGKVYFSKSEGDWTERKYLEIMQFTGLSDKNGVEIFEGDILKYTRKNIYCPSASFHNKDLVSNVEIYWSEDRNAMSQRTIDLSRKNQPPYLGSGYLSSNGFKDGRAGESIIEVIGNIYQNPELLK